MQKHCQVHATIIDPVAIAFEVLRSELFGFPWAGQEIFGILKASVSVSEKLRGQPPERSVWAIASIARPFQYFDQLARWSL